MSNEATVKLSLDGRDYESGKDKAIRGMKAMSETAKAESAKAAEAMRVQSAATGMIRRERELLAAQNKLIAKGIADEAAAQAKLRKELDEINKVAAKSLALKQQAHKVDTSARLANIKGGALSNGQSEGAKNARIANVGAQFQDVLVQAQMGARWTTIIAQQGPQIISALGGTGKMAGAAAGAAVGVIVSMALADMVVNSGKAFDEMVVQAKGASIEMGKISFLSGDQSGLARAVEIYKENLKAMREQEKAGSSKGARALAWIDEHTGGKSAAEKETEKSAAKKALEFSRQQINERSLEISQNTQEIAKLTAADDEAGIERLQRKLKLQQKIYELGLSGLGRDETAKAVAAETALSDAEQIASDKKRQEARAKSAQDFIESIEEDERQSREKRLARDKKAGEEKLQFEKEQVEEFHKREDERQKASESEAKRRGEEIYSTDKDRVAAENALTEAAEKRLSVSEQIAIASKRVADAEANVAHQMKVGNEASQNTAKANLARARGAQIELSLQRAAQFVGKSSAQVRKADRDEAKEKRELDKAGKRAIEADIRKADAANRRAGGLGLNEAQKARMREAGNKALGKDIQADSAKQAAASLTNIEKSMAKMAEKLGVAK